jgi:DNA-binding protein HU-beta
MAKAMTKSAILKTLVEKTGLKKKEVAAVIEGLVALAYREARNTFVVPGLGKLVLVQRPARTMIMRFGPKAGQTVPVPAKKVVKFRVAKAAKEAILK